jgi:hypothetical protein
MRKETTMYRRHKPYTPPKILRQKPKNNTDADGVDAIKDANAEAGRDPYNREGYYDAKRNGWLEESGEYEIDQ